MSSSTVINTNCRALNANRNLRAVGNTQDKASRRLSSGKKINSAADDAAGLAISQKMKSQIRGLDMASKNAQDATSFVQTVEGYTGEIQNMVQRIRELAVQSATDTNEADADREKLDTEVQQLLEEIDGIADRAQFNKIDLNSTEKFQFQVGANANQFINLDLQELGTGGIAADVSGASVDTKSDAQDAIESCDDAIAAISTYRATLGAVQNRLEYTNNSLETASENLSTANSRIEDADMAKEMTNITSANVINQAAISMLSQANQSQQSVLSLLQ